MIEVREYQGGRWSYWTSITQLSSITEEFNSFNEISFYDIDLSFLIPADSVQVRIVMITMANGFVLKGQVFVDDFSLVARSGYEGQTFGSFYNEIIATPVNERQAKADGFMNILMSCPLIEETSVTFLYQGDVGSVNVPGDQNGWNTYFDPMIRIQGTDLWFFQTSFEPDARIEYKFYIDDFDWIRDPLNPDTSNLNYINSLVEMQEYVPPAEVEYNEDIPHGNYSVTPFTSSIMGNTRNIGVYTPPGYTARADEKYPVILVHDGIEYYHYGKFTNVLDNLIAENRIQEVIAVFVPPINRTDEYAWDLTDEFEDFIMEELMPYIDNEYRTKPDPSGRAMMGSSFGGLISTQICYNNPNEFGLCAPYSPAYSPKSFEVLNSVMNGDVKPIKFYLEWGSYEHDPNFSYDIVVYATKLKYYLEDAGYTYIWNVWNEGHNYASWRAHLDNMLEYFFPAVAGVQEPDASNPFALKCYPNPVTSATSITYDLKDQSNVHLSVCDLSGKEKAVLVNEKQPQGIHKIEWDTGNLKGVQLASGAYLIKLKVPINVNMRKCEHDSALNSYSDSLLSG